MFGIKKKTFKGGAYPDENKDMTKDKQIEVMPAPEKVIVPLQQHIGTPSEEIVKKGDAVKMGDKLSEPKGFVSIPVHSPVSGKVLKIDEYDHPLGTMLRAIEIENDGEDSLSDSVKPVENYLDLHPDEIRERIKQTGIAGMGGAAFPTHVKLSPPKGKTIDTLIINGSESEPYLTSDYRLMIEYPDEILKGIQIIQKILDIKRIIIAVKENKPEAIRLFREKVKPYREMKVVPLKTKYPQGAEKQLIQAITDREVPPGGLPMDVECLVQNVGTSRAIYQALAHGIPLYQRVLTVNGPGVEEPKNLMVRIGTKIGDVIHFCGGYKEDVAKLLMGGPMMGIAQYTDEVPVVKGTSGIILLDEASLDHTPVRPCINCGRCVDVCPMGLMPTMLGKLIKYEQYGEAEKYRILDCMECGTCTYICPARRPLLQYIRYGKNKVIKYQRKAS